MWTYTIQYNSYNNYHINCNKRQIWLMKFKVINKSWDFLIVLCTKILIYFIRNKFSGVKDTVHPPCGACVHEIVFPQHDMCYENM